MDSSTLHPTNAHVSSEYGADAITVLEGLEAVRKRPGMYIGSTGQRGLHHLIYEIVDNSVDEALAGQCDHLTVTIHPDQRVSVRDNGRGIPVDIQEQTGRPAAEVVLTVLHAGGKFGEGGGYKVSGGLHGVGVSVVNALSEHLELTVWRDGGMHRQEYERGAPKYDLQRIEDSDDHGTEIRFMPDAEIFEELVYDRDILTQRFREMAFLTRGLRIDFCDERGESHLESFQYDGGLRDFVTYLHSQGTRSPVHPEVVYFTEATDIGEVEIAMQWNDSYQENLLSFANNINTHEGGSHLAGFRGALTRTLNNYARSEGVLKEKDPNLTGEDMREGLTAIISVKIADPQFEGQTKTKLGNPPVEGLVNSIVGKGFSQFLEENPATGRLIIDKAMQAARAREAARKARDLTRRKSALESGSLPGKLADCATKDPAKAEIFVVEGDSAGGCGKFDTAIQLANGTTRTFEELAKDWEHGIRHFGYAADDQGDIKIVPLIAPRLTKKNASLIEVTLDNGAKVSFTPDHLFKTRDGAYCRADHLKEGQSLMPLKIDRTTKEDSLADPNGTKGYEKIWMNGEQRWALPQLVGRDSLDNNLSPPVVRTDRKRDETSMLEAARNYNCKVTCVQKVVGLYDVYDLTVEQYHNFALASGVFVHNSAKQGRTRETQAVLPLRGKIINAEKNRMDKVLSSVEIQAMVTAIGTGIREEFDISKARYHKIIVCSVDGKEHGFIRQDGVVRMVKIGEWIDRQLSLYERNDPRYSKLKQDEIEQQLGEVMCFGLSDSKVKFSPIKAIIRHTHTQPLYKITTAYGRNLSVTAEHSVFVDKEGRPELKRGGELVCGERLVAPRFMNFPDLGKTDVNILKDLHNKPQAAAQVYLRGSAVEEWYKRKIVEQADSRMTEKRVYLTPAVGNLLSRYRKESGLSNRELCTAVGIRQPCTFYDWEKGNNKPVLSHFQAYAQAIGAPATVIAQVEIQDSTLEHIWRTNYNSQAIRKQNKLRNYVLLSDLNEEDTEWFEQQEDYCLTPRHYASHQVPPSLPISPELMFLLGLYMAEGCTSDRNGVRFAMGKNNRPFVAEVTSACEKVFGVTPKCYPYSGEAGADDLKIVNRVVALIMQHAFGFYQVQAPTKKIPDLIWNVSKELQLEFLRGYFLGDGTLNKNGISFASTSHDIISGLQYLFSQWGVMGGFDHRVKEATTQVICGRLCNIRPIWSYTISCKEDLRLIRRVWESNRNARQLEQRLERSQAANNRPFNEMSGNLVSLPITSINQVPASSQSVYDFSVEEDENFIAGQGGLCTHNTDADVDGAHIKTLILTFLFRQMPELIEAGYIYVAKPPLYKVKSGKQEIYIDREQELEAFVLRDKLENFVITDGEGGEHQFTQEGWLKFTRVLNQFESWSNKLRSKHGSETVEVLLNTRLIDIGVQSDFLDILGAGVEDELHKLELVEATDERITLRVQEKLSHLATVYRVPRSMFGEEEFGELAKLHIALQGFIGPGPFHVGLDRHESRQVASAPLVRRAVVEMAKEGVSLQRFKGLGEMNPDQLFATTMDPARRTLMRVTIDDATAADLVFSMLMGEEVPPRRQFIEDHARNVDNLDI